MSLAPGSSRVVVHGGTPAAPNTPQGKIFGSGKTVKSVTLNPASPLEYGRTVSGGVANKFPSSGAAATSISGATVSGTSTVSSGVST